MCGIAGIWSLNPLDSSYQLCVNRMVAKMRFRGPDSTRVVGNPSAILGHARLSIIDLSEAANQPMLSLDGNWMIVFNGEIFNFQSLRDELRIKGKVFQTNSDTEVLLQLFLEEGPSMLNRLNGFFAFAIYNIQDNRIFLARDRFGEKPLFYTEWEGKLAFCSEVRGIQEIRDNLVVDEISKHLYFRYSYIPGPHTIWREVYHLLPGHYMWGGQSPVCWYQLPSNVFSGSSLPSYEESKSMVHHLVTDAVQLRLVSDVPVGAFLSGGIDSSVVVSCASATSSIQTFSIGFADEPRFDETKYAKLVSDRFSTQHTVFSLTNNDLLDSFFPMMNSVDQPFADSSSLAVHLLSKKTRESVTVALSGDGGDELFSGYMKHLAEYKIRQMSRWMRFLSIAGPLLSCLPKSRYSRIGNVLRKLEKLSRGASLGDKSRYLEWAAFSSIEDVKALLGSKTDAETLERMSVFTENISVDGNMNDVLRSDFALVLPYDMLVKVDTMSMANSLEVRSPLLDYRLVDFVFQLPFDYKFREGRVKKLFIDSFSASLPVSLLNRPKQGFEVPLRSWFSGPLKSYVEQTLMDKTVFNEENFELSYINNIVKSLRNNSSKDSSFRIWSLLIWSNWVKNNLS
jgi:asparagine synthase (glutamine-hydrolysing)